MSPQNRPVEIVMTGHRKRVGRLLPNRRVIQRRERGSIAIMSVASFMVIFAVCGLALELSQVYNRKVELNSISKALALAAARELNGSAAGVTQAITQASAVAQSYRYQYGRNTFTWSDSVLTFSKFPDSNGSWVDAATARATPAGLFYARVDTSKFDGVGEIKTVFLRLLSELNATVIVPDVAIAGRTTVRAMPMAVCAMGAPAEQRPNTGSTGTSNELVQYGFRRGITYDLMQLNPSGTSPANFVIDPFLAPGMVSGVSHTSAKAIRPFVCTGTMWMPHVTGGAIKIAQDFPLSDVFEQFNSRFDQYEGSVGERCEPGGAPPDVNVMAYKFDLPLPWMTDSPTAQRPAGSTQGGRLATVADLAQMPIGSTAPEYGPLWNYAKAVPYSQYSAGTAEPSSGYTTFSFTQWGSLYKPAPLAKNYPGTSPYMSGLTAHTTQPSLANRGRAERFRRVLHVPLVSCPAAIGSESADVLAVAKFFMTVPATKQNLYVEFAGIASQEALRGQVELFP